MELQELQPFLESENNRLLETLPGLTQKNIALAQSVKLAEEAGELGKAVLEDHGLQRERQGEGTPAVEAEIADVIITAMLLGETLGIDLEDVLSAKINEIEDRYD